MQMNPERNICRRSSQKRRGETRAPMGGGAGGQDLGPDLLCHQFLILDRETLPLRERFPTVTFHFLLRGQGLSQPLHPGLAVGRVCVRSARLRGGGVGEGREELSLQMIFPGVIPPCSLYLLSSVIHKGRRREICKFPFEK